MKRLIDSWIDEQYLLKCCLNYYNCFFPLDTFVTTQLVEEDRCFLTRRSGIIRPLTNPLYRHTVKYLASDVSRRILMASVWAQPPPEMKYDPSLASEAHEECIGVAKINIDKLVMRQLMVGWYKLFPPLVM